MVFVKINDKCILGSSQSLVTLSYISSKGISNFQVRASLADRANIQFREPKQHLLIAWRFLTIYLAKSYWSKGLSRRKSYCLFRQPWLCRLFNSSVASWRYHCGVFSTVNRSGFYHCNGCIRREIASSKKNTALFGGIRRVPALK